MFVFQSLKNAVQVHVSMVTVWITLGFTCVIATMVLVESLAIKISTNAYRIPALDTNVGMMLTHTFACVLMGSPVQIVEQK